MKRFVGQLTTGIQWMTGSEPKWSAVCEAHRDELPDIDEYVPGTFNVTLTEPSSWRPPLDDYWRVQARLRGMTIGKTNKDKGGDFMFCGNYIHPLLRVTQINQLPVEGRVYYPGSQHWRFDNDGMPVSVDRPRIEIISKTELRRILQMSDVGQLYDIEVIVEVFPAPWIS